MVAQLSILDQESKRLNVKIHFADDMFRLYCLSGRSRTEKAYRNQFKRERDGFIAEYEAHTGQEWQRMFPGGLEEDELEKAMVFYEGRDVPVDSYTIRQEMGLL